MYEQFETSLRDFDLDNVLLYPYKGLCKLHYSTFNGFLPSDLISGSTKAASAMAMRQMGSNGMQCDELGPHLSALGMRLVRQLS